MHQWTEALWTQFGAAIDALDDAIVACPDSLWRQRVWDEPPEMQFSPGFAEFWYVAYHTLFWIDVYQFGSGEGFAPHAPFSLDEFDPSGKVPETPYTKAELRDFLQYVREKCRASFASMTESDWNRRCSFPWMRGDSAGYFELQLYNMRHVQEHVGQLNLFLGQREPGAAPGWVARARS